MLKRFHPLNEVVTVSANKLDPPPMVPKIVKLIERIASTFKVSKFDI